MTTIINAVSGSGLTQTADGSGIVKLQSNGVTTNALAWVNFNGTTSPGTIRSQYNVSSVTKNGTGDYTVNFTTALSDANYCIQGTGSPNSTTNTRVIGPPETSTPTTTSVRVQSQADTGALQDSVYANVTIFGN